jgi:hypothetical protein
MTKPKTDIDPKAAVAEVFKRTGGIAGMTSWAKTHKTLFYNLYAKLISQPLVQNNVAVSVNADGEAARRKLETALMRLIDARKASVGDPAVYINGERLRDDGVTIEQSPMLTHAADPRPATPDAVVEPESSTSPKQGPLFSRGGVAATPGAGPKNENVYSTGPLKALSIPSLAAGAALDQTADDKLSTTERFLLWRGHGGPP